MRVVVTALVAGLVVGCNGGGGDEARIEDHLSHRVVECWDAVDVVEEPGPNYTVLGSGDGFVALPAGTMQLGRWGSEGSVYEDYRFSKFGLPVRRFRQVSLKVISAPDDAVLTFGDGRDEPVGALTAGPCDTEGPECEIEPTENLSVGPCGTGRGEWVVWAGGIWVNEPGCVELVVSSDGGEIPVRLAVAASCDATA